MIYDQAELVSIGFEFKEAIMHSADNFNRVIMYLNQIDILHSLREKIWLKRNEINKNNPYGFIYVIGKSEVSKPCLIAIAEELGINRNRLKFCLDYSETQKFPFSSLQYNSNIALVMIGPMPHSTKDKGLYSSTLSKIKNAEGFPPIIRLGFENLKITKTNYKNALVESIKKLLISVNQ